MNINEYHFKSHLNYLIYYRGGFSPTTRGHFSLVEKFCHLPNVYYFIHQIGERHGLPYKFSRKIFKIYLRLLDYDRITLQRMDTSLEVLDHIEKLKEEKNKKIDVVIYLKGAETAEPMTYEEGKVIYRRLGRRFSPLRRALREKDIKFEFLFIDRPKMEVLSATKFTEAVKDRKPKGYLKSFVPINLPDDDFDYIIRNMKKYV